MRTGGIRLNRERKQYVSIPDSASLDLTSYTITFAYRAERQLTTPEEKHVLLSKGSIVDGQQANYFIFVQFSLLEIGVNYHLVAGYRDASYSSISDTSGDTSWAHPGLTGRWSGLALIVDGSGSPTTISIRAIERKSVLPPLEELPGTFGDPGPDGLTEAAPAGNSRALILGASYDASGVLENFADISLSEIAIYNTALTVATLNGRFGTRLTGNESNLVAYYPCDEGSGSTLYDVSGGGHDGTLMNNPAWTDGPLDLEY